MALKGNLRDFNISQLFNLINLARKTGTLIVESTNEKVMVSFREGKLSYAHLSQEDNSLAAVLYRAKKLSASQYRLLKERFPSLNDKELGLMLVNANYIDQQTILTSLQAHFVNIVNRLFVWGEGLFRFENDLLPPDDKITVRMSLENIIIEGSRRMKELEQLKEEIPDLDMALKFAERPGANIRNFSLSMNEWRVVSYINPKNTIRKIARAVRMSDVEIRRIIYGLLQAGLVEVVQPEGVSFPPMPVPVRPVISQPHTEEQKSLINRIIKRIRTL